MHWVLQDNLFNEAGCARLVETLERFDIAHSVHRIESSTGELDPVPVLDHANAICMGSYAMRHFARRYGWTPGVFDLEPFDFTVQRQHWGQHMLNHDSVLSTLAAVVFPGEQAFVRPVKDSKHFTGRLMQRDEFERWRHQVCVQGTGSGAKLDSDTVVQVCRPKQIFSEHRFWIVDGEIVTSSTYKVGHRVVYKPLDDERFAEFVDARVNEWQPHKAFVIDVCDTPDGTKAVEINTLNFAAVYAGDMNRLVIALEDAFDACSKPSPFGRRP